jgi:hypothetical protein
MRQMMEQAQTMKQKKGTVTADDMTEIMMNVVGQTTALDEKSMELFGKLAK